MDLLYGQSTLIEYRASFRERTPEEIIAHEIAIKKERRQEMLDDYIDWIKEMVKFSIYFITGFAIIGTPVLLALSLFCK